MHGSLTALPARFRLIWSAGVLVSVGLVTFFGMWSDALLFGGAAIASVAYAFGFWSERLRAVRRLQRECEERYERAGRSANDGLWECELDTGRTYFSERLAEMLGCSRADMAPHIDAWFERVHPADLASFKDAVDAHRDARTDRLEHEHRVRCADGVYLWVLVRGVISSAGGLERLTVWTTDISARKQAEQELRFHAFRDPLTGLANRSLFGDRLAQAMARARELHGPQIAVLLIDLDRFKRVNDSLGHGAGDGFLMAISDRLRACVRSGDTVARLGGDEFALLIEDVASAADATEAANRVQKTLFEPVVTKGRVIQSGCSIGIVVAGRGSETPADVMRDADTAMYHAKALGRGQWAMFDPSLRARAVERLNLETELRSSLLNGELEVFYQPIVDGSSAFAGFEALPRWRHPRLGMLLPGDFIGLAEETGLIMDLGDLVLSEACELGRRVLEAIGPCDFTVNVNLSPKQIRRSDLASRIENILDSVGLDPSYLCVEVTEDLILEELPFTENPLHELRAQGVKLCMDDFGTGYSSLSYLHRFRVDFLKIETAFVHGAETREGGAQIVRSLVNLARNLGVVAVAEGVETERQWDVLRNLGCPRAQGFYFSEPLSASELMRWVTERLSACA